MSGRDQASFYDVDTPFVNEVQDRRLERLVEFLGAATAGRPIKRALDIGCANGRLLDALPSHVEKHGIDVSENLLGLARNKGIRTVLLDVDAKPLPYGAADFDLVIATDVIEHIQHTDALLNEINRVLAPGGLFIAGIPNVNQPVSFVMQFILDLTPMYSARYRCTHYRDFSHRLFRMILARHGFAIARQEGSYLYPFERSRLLTALVRRVPRWGCQLFYAARKRADAHVAEGFAGSMPELLAWLKEPDGRQ